MLEKVKTFFHYFTWKSNRKVIREISVDNLNSMYFISFIIVALECLALVTFLFRQQTQAEYVARFFRISFCIVSCMFIALVTGYLRREMKKKQVIPYAIIYFLLVLFYVMLTAWGIWCDIRHYVEGTQMMTFYIVQFCFAAFVVLHPFIGTVMYSLGFGALICTVLYIDRGQNIEIQNLITYMLIASMGSYVKYIATLHQKQQHDEVIRLNRQLGITVKNDDLTGLKNRYSFRIDFDSFMNQTICVIMMDIDFFKKYNDTCGHLLGDEVLSKFAGAVKEVYGTEYSYRFGGDEFLIVMKDDSEEVFVEKMKLFSKTVSEIKIDGIDEVLSFSMGHHISTITDASSLRAAIQKADDQLYEYKKIHHKNA